MKLLDRTLLRLLDRARLPVRPQIAARDQGAHRSPILASGVEFADHRKYVPGDDVRHVDWKAFARHRQLLVRQFTEDRDIRVYVLMDASRSMERGATVDEAAPRGSLLPVGRSKLGLAKTMAAAFAYVGTKDFDRVRVLPFATDVDATVPVVRSRMELPALDNALDEELAIDAPETSFVAAARAFSQRYVTRGMCVVITDLMAPDGWEEGLRRLASLGHQLIVVHVQCDEDDKPDLRGEVELVDSESGELVRLRVTPSLLEQYRKLIGEHAAKVEDVTKRAGGRYVAVRVEESPEIVARRVLVAGGGKA